MLAIRLRWRGSTCWTTRTAAGKLGGSPSRTAEIAVRPPAEAAMATMSKVPPTRSDIGDQPPVRVGDDGVAVTTSRAPFRADLARAAGPDQCQRALHRIDRCDGLGHERRDGRHARGPSDPTVATRPRPRPHAPPRLRRFVPPA